MRRSRNVDNHNHNWSFFINNHHQYKAKLRSSRLFSPLSQDPLFWSSQSFYTQLQPNYTQPQPPSVVDGCSLFWLCFFKGQGGIRRCAVVIIASRATLISSTTIDTRRCWRIPLFSSLFTQNPLFWGSQLHYTQLCVQQRRWLVVVHFGCILKDKKVH